MPYTKIVIDKILKPMFGNSKATHKVSYYIGSGLFDQRLCSCNAEDHRLAEGEVTKEINYAGF